MKTNDSLAVSLLSPTMYGRKASACAQSWLLLLLLMLPAAVQAQFNYTTNNGTITITRYTGPGGAVVIPTTINGLPVTSIGSSAFYLKSAMTSVTIPNSVTSIGDGVFAFCTGLTGVTIPNSVTRIGDQAFVGCTGLTSIAVDPLNSSYVGLEGVLFDKSLTILLQFPGGKTGSYTLPNSVTSIGRQVFDGCTGLTSVTIPNSVTSIGDRAFSGCTGLTSVTIPNSVTRIRDGVFSFCTGLTGLYFLGRIPESEDPISTFVGAEQVTVYYLPGSTGWGGTFGGRPTALWLPRVRTDDASFGVRNNAFGFDVSWAPGMSVVVEAATDLANPVWSPLQTLTLTGDSICFSDPQWTTQPARFYRPRSP